MNDTCMNRLLRLITLIEGLAPHDDRHSAWLRTHYYLEALLDAEVVSAKEYLAWCTKIDNAYTLRKF